MRRKGTIKSLPSDSSDDEPLSNLRSSKQKKPSNTDDSSSESDIENYLQRPDKLDFDSEFFNLEKPANPPESDTKVNRLTDSESEKEEVSPPTENFDEPSTSNLNFNQLNEYTKKLEEAKKHVEEYNKRKAAQEKEMNIDNLLAAGESNLSEELKQFEGTLHSSDFESCSDSEKEGWEEVKEKDKEKEKAEVPKEGLQITVEMPGAVKKKKGVDLLLAIKRRINRVRKENQVLIHKVHLLCWIAHGNYLNSKINSQNVLGVALSLLPNENCYPANRTDLKYLEQIVKWYRNTVTIIEKPVPDDKPLEELLQLQISKKEAFNKKMFVLIFVAIMRSLGIQCRLVLSFQVEPLRPPNSELHSLSTKTDDKGESKARSKSTKVEDNKPSTSDVSKPKKIEPDKPKPKKPSDSKTSKKNESSKAKTSGLGTVKSEENTLKKEEAKPSKLSKLKDVSKTTKARSKSEVKDEAKPRVSARLKSLSSKDEDTQTKQKSSLKEKVENARKTRSKKQIPPQLDGANDTQTTSKPNLKKLKQKQPPCPIKDHPKRLKTERKYRDSSESEDDFSTRSPFAKKNIDSPQNRNGMKNDVRKDIIDIMKKTIKEKKDLDRTKKVKKKRISQDSEDDSDYVLEAVPKKQRESDDEFVAKVKVKRRVQAKPDPDQDKVKKKQGLDVWVEVFLEAEEKWISVDVVKGQVHCVKELYTRASHPVAYVVAWNNNNTIKDITRRYCTNFNTVTRKLRIDAKWWDATLKPFTGLKTVRDKEEDDELERQQLEKPLPTSIAEYKNHPLYVLKRHLLKFEALYPPDPPTLGFVRNEPVYSRQCVYTLHSRDIWLKHAKVVKLGEQPYKIVKARPRWDKLSQKIVTDQLLEVFGPWQVEDYVPPTAENGIVPRNAFGNVELFKPCMLPKGTVHLKLPALNKIAKRMNIDCAAALIGFDFHGGWNHPTYDGFVVCEEFADELVAAWEIEQDEIEKKEQDKIDKRVYGNWRKLIRGLLIRERLKAKYEFGEPSKEGKGKKKAKAKTSAKKRIIESDDSDD